MNKKVYIILGISLLAASVAFYFYKKEKAFVPTEKSVTTKIEIVFNP
jgi:hypothetical protein